MSTDMVEKAEVNRVLQQAFGSEVADLLVQIVTLKNALRPFAEASRRFDESAFAVVGEVPPGNAVPAGRFTHTQLRVARSALEDAGG